MYAKPGRNHAVLGFCVAVCLLQDCVRRMLTRDPTARATATEVLNHEWVKEDGVAGDVEIEPEVRAATHTQSCAPGCAPVP